jgi:hypothetical protein
VRIPLGRIREPRGLTRLSIENSLFAVFKPANMFLAVELDAELFDELQLRFQKIDVLFLIDEQLVIELLGDEVVGGNAIFRRLGVERSRGNLGVEVTAKNFLDRLSDPQRVEDFPVVALLAPD